MLHGRALIVLLVTNVLVCHASVESTRNDTDEGVNFEEVSEAVPLTVTDDNVEVADGQPGEAIRQSSSAGIRLSQTPRRRQRRPRGYYNDIRYRNPANNPYNPNSPYAFRGRPGQPQLHQRQQDYTHPYYDPYNQYYGYPEYSPVQPNPQPYYQYPYQPQVRAQQQPPVQTEAIPDLYYVQKSDSPDGQYQYKKVSVAQDGYSDSRGRRRGSRWSQPYGQTAPGYYNYPYDPYRKPPPPPPPPPQQQYYQPYPYPQQYPQYYQYPKPPRSRTRGGRSFYKPTASPTDWKLTLAPVTSDTQPESAAVPTTEPS